MSTCFNCYWIYNFQNRKYPKNIRKMLNAKYKALHKHEKSIKNILKNSEHSFKIWKFRFGKTFVSLDDLIRIKRHRKMINKIQKEINNMKNYYDGLQ